MMRKMMNPAKWLSKKKIPFEELEVHACPNCEHEFKGHYCPNCGQSDSEFDRPAGFVFYDFLGNLFAFDTRLLHTFRDLLFRPGFLTSEFFKGKRVRYTPPFRLYIFMSFVLFLLLQIMSNKALDLSFERALQNDYGGVKADSVIESRIDTVNAQLGTVQFGKQDSMKVDIDLTDFLKSKNIRESLAIVADKVDNKVQAEKDPGQKKKLLELSSLLRSPQQLTAKLLKYLSWAFFILLPLFAMLLKLFYIRRRIYYIRHLIFSVHIHAFMFVILSLVVASNLIFSSAIGTLSFWLLMFIPIYIYLAVLNFYRQGYLKTFLKFILIGFIYNFILIASILYVFILALNVI